ncbi:13037_t:CDS:2 [Ambispora leptoticha]|uniref:13037_t:CDS:1 n=1 Tax=Ambispora leptoticha TaxID=144679 RepID=A0A9N9BBV9_9GLOM|nr:13037_t:CDS:2 [Ambispora leptoticha]
MFAMFKSPVVRISAIASSQIRYFSLYPPSCNRFLELVNDIRSQYPINEITPKELQETLSSSRSNNQESDVVVIDVREKDEHLRGVIPGAIPLPRGILERDVERKVIGVDEVNKDNGKNVVVYCAGGVRSILAAESLIRLGYKKENVKSLLGGYEGWKQSGFKTENYKES